MLTFSVNLGDNFSYSTQVWDTINSNIRYFKKFNGVNWAEAAQKAYVYAMEHKDDRYDDITPYIKKLARTILKVKDKEKPYDMWTEDGEVALVFTGLTETMDESMFSDIQDIKNTFKELFLFNQNEFMKLKYVFQYDNDKDILSVKSIMIKDEQLKRELYSLVNKYSAACVFYTLYDFFKMLPKYVEVTNTRRIKEIQAKEGNFLMLARIPETACIKTTDGKYHSIDRNTLRMDIDPDFVKWDTSFSTNCDIMRIDLSPLMDYMYEQVYVEQGVKTNHISWCDDKYKLVSPGGTVSICEDRDKFMDMVRIEAVLNIIANNVNTIIALSPDSIYIKPTRSVYFNMIRYKLFTGKCIDLPITVHIRKRKIYVG